MAPSIRKGTPDPHIDERTFRARFFSRFFDPAFEAIREQLERAADIAWEAYGQSRKAPRTRVAGPELSDPNYELSEEWTAARSALLNAQARQRDAALPARILIINGSPRSEHTCPGEMSKTYRLVQAAQRHILDTPGFACDVLDLSRLASEYGRQIFPCKACFSTSPALCHWPCSCYPNHALAQTPDWMNEIYPMWAAAHGILIVTPVHWYHVPAGLKLMMDRLVCADGGNPDPTRTQGKDAALAKELEQGWEFPQHLAGRVFAVVVHGDSAGTEPLRRALADWMTDIGLRSAGAMAQLDRYVGYYQPYGASHDALDHDGALCEEVKNVALTLVEAVRRYRAGAEEPGSSLSRPRPR